MPKTKRGKPLYHRGGFSLYPRPGRNHEIIWYDIALGRERSASAGTTDLETAKAALDAKYVEVTRGIECCPICHRPYEEKQSPLVTLAIEVARQDAIGKASEAAINHRLDHVARYIATLPSAAVQCADASETWIAGFRKWNLAQPIVTRKGERPRAASTVENSVLQLASAIRGLKEEPLFKPIPAKEVNRSPRYRADIPKLAEMIRYCLSPEPGRYGTERERQRRIRERRNLLAFIRASIVTLARPDAVHDISTAPTRGQWMANAHALDLNPKGRKQTKKYRATVPIAAQAVWIFEECEGFLIPVDSVENAFVSMAVTIGLPRDGEGGMKVIRRSMAKLVRDRLPIELYGELEMFMGHAKLDPTTDIYAPFDPSYLARAKAVIEDIVDEIEKLVPGAFYRDFTAQGGNVASISRGLSA